MSNEKDPDRALTPKPHAPRELTLGQAAKIDLSSLPEATQQELAKLQAEGLLGLQKKGLEAGLDVKSLDESLKTIAETTKDLSHANVSVSAEHRVKSTVGETTVKMGNTPSARFGCFNTIGFIVITGLILRWLLS